MLSIRSLISSGLCVLLPLALWAGTGDEGTGDGGGDSSGGTSFDIATNHTLDASTFEEPIRPLEKYANVMGSDVIPIIEKIRARVPVLAEHLERVFLEKVWWQTRKPLSGRDAGSKIKAKKELVIDQDKLSVLVTKSFDRKSRADQVTSLIHEGVRFLAIDRGLKMKDQDIQLITRLIEHGSWFKTDEELRDYLYQTGIGYYLTRSEHEQIVAKSEAAFKKHCPLPKLPREYPFQMGVYIKDANLAEVCDHYVPEIKAACRKYLPKVNAFEKDLAEIRESVSAVRKAGAGIRDSKKEVEVWKEAEILAGRRFFTGQSSSVLTNCWELEYFLKEEKKVASASRLQIASTAAGIAQGALQEVSGSPAAPAAGKVSRAKDKADLPESATAPTSPSAGSAK